MVIVVWCKAAYSIPRYLVYCCTYVYTTVARKGYRVENRARVQDKARLQDFDLAAFFGRHYVIGRNNIGHSCCAQASYWLAFRRKYLTGRKNARMWFEIRVSFRYGQFFLQEICLDERMWVMRVSRTVCGRFFVVY